MVTKAVTGQLTIFECIFSIDATRNKTQVSKETGKVPAESFINVSEKIKVYGSAALKEKQCGLSGIFHLLELNRRTGY